MKKSNGAKKYFNGNKEFLELDDEINDGLKILAHIIAHHHIKKTSEKKTSKTMQINNSNKRRRKNK